MLSAIVPPRRVCTIALKIATAIAAIVLLMAVASMLGGCQGTIARKSYITVDGANAAVNGLADAYDAKLLTKAQITALLPYADAIKAAEDDVDHAILAKRADLSTVLQGLTDAVVAFDNAKGALKAGKPLPAIPATQPH